MSVTNYKVYLAQSELYKSIFGDEDTIREYPILNTILKKRSYGTRALYFIGSKHPKVSVLSHFIKKYKLH